MDELTSISKQINLDINSDDKCPDFDEDCSTVENHERCFIGISPSGIDIGRALGYCPFAQNSN